MNLTQECSKAKLYNIGDTQTRSLLFCWHSRCYSDVQFQCLLWFSSEELWRN